MFSRRTRSKLSFDSFLYILSISSVFVSFFSSILSPYTLLHSPPSHTFGIPPPPTVQTIVDYFRIRISSFDRVIFANSIGFVT